MTIQIDNADLDGFQVEPTLCTDVSNCFVTLASTAVTDMSGNDVTGVLASSPGTVGSVVADTIPPELVAFDANLGNGTLTLTFSEIVNVSTVSPEALTLLNNFTASLATSSFQLTGGRVSGKDGAAYTRVVTVGLLVVDMYEIQQVLDLAVSVNTTFVATSTQLVDDMAGNAVVAISAAGTVLQVTRFAADTVAPSLVSFTLNVDTAQLSITFDEAILASSFNVSGIVLQAANAVPAGAGTDVRLRLNETSTVSNINAPVINVTLTTDDLDLIKLGSAFCISTSTCFISLDRTTATDANTQPVEVASGVVASSVVADSTSPSVVSVALDMDTNTLEFVFDEPVNATSLSATSITLQSATNSPSASYTLTGSDSSSANNGRVVSVVMTTGDVNAIKALSGLVRDQATSNVAVSSSMIADMAGNNVVAIAVTSAVGVSSFTADTTSPTLVEFSADMTLGLLKMTFDETVDSSSFVTTSVQLRESAEAVAATYNLTGGTVPSQLSTVVTLLFTRSDLNIIKADTELFTNGQTAFVSIASGIINDVFGNLANEVNATSAIQASAFVDDTKAARLRSFALDMSLLQLTLTFSETVNASSFDVTQLTIQNAASGASSAINVSDGVVITGFDPVVIVNLTVADANKLKEETSLAVTESNTFLAFSSTLVADMNGIQVEQVATNNATQAQTVVVDAVAIIAETSAVDMSLGSILVTFDEPVDPTSIDDSAMSLVGKADGSGTSIALDGASSARINPLQIQLNMTEAVLNEVKSVRYLCTSTSNCFVSLNNDAVADRASNGNVASVVPVTLFTSDTIRPQLVAFNFTGNGG
jgi:hypothetical protein